MRNRPGAAGASTGLAVLRAAAAVTAVAWIAALGCASQTIPAAPPAATAPAPSPSASSVVGETPASVLSAQASGYLTTALDIIQANALHAKELDWPALRAQAFAAAAGAETPADTHHAIRLVLSQLGDRGHSSFHTWAQWDAAQKRTIRDLSLKPRGDLQGRLGYVLLPSFGGSDADHEFATLVQKIIRDTDAQHPCGWIVDLWQNSGGNVFPMLAGLGPLTGEGTLGGMVSPDGRRREWSYRNGQALVDVYVQSQVNGPAYTLANPAAPVALLTSSNTASAAEAIVLSFRGRPNTRTFGEATHGWSTANQGFELSDASWLILTVAVMTDRSGQTFGGEIRPDVLLRGPEDTYANALQAATDWLLSQPACTR